MPIPQSPLEKEARTFFRAVARRRIELEWTWERVAAAADTSVFEIKRLPFLDDCSARCVIALSRWLRTTRPR
jgi:hypothetical protein